MQIRTSVRNLVEFLYRSGDFDRSQGKASTDAMAQGSRIHRKLQSGRGSSYKAELALKYIDTAGDYQLLIEGRADGVIDQSLPDGPAPDSFTIEEIKGTYANPEKMKEALPVHLAQAKCYGAMYVLERGYFKSDVILCLTYCNMDTEDIRQFKITMDSDEIIKWFKETIVMYRCWTDLDYYGRQHRNRTIKDLDFPFPYRRGQRELMVQVYSTLRHERKLFLQAPTGTGKTLATLYPAIKAMGEGHLEKIFYLTARTVARQVAEQGLGLLGRKGLWKRAITLTARDRICPLDKPLCQPDKCERARGHFDRINEALYDLLTQGEDYTAATISLYGERYGVCPFELSLDAAVFCHVIICDYNYAFDPEARLQRFFGESKGQPYIFLVDEAHNLLDRGREMYSASLGEGELGLLKKILSGRDGRIVSSLRKVRRLLKETYTGGSPARDVSGEVMEVAVKDSLIRELYVLQERLGAFFDRRRRALRHRDMAQAQAISDEDLEAVLQVYFQISHLLEMYDPKDDGYYNYMRDEKGLVLWLYCVDPSRKLRACMDMSLSTILFSATFLPIQYYKGLLGGYSQDYEVYASSSFDPGRLGVFIGTDVSSRYSQRGRNQYLRMAGYIADAVSVRRGRYMAFFPSYRYMEEVRMALLDLAPIEGLRLLVQSPAMGEAQKAEFLEAFRQEDEAGTLLGFCVLGGAFSEGIDLTGDSLIGVIVAGTGAPMVCSERDIIRAFFQDRSGSGYDYAYRYPGMNRVLQAAGRLIRTATDRGFILLLDDRFTEATERRLFPREWQNIALTDSRRVHGDIDSFWRRMDRLYGDTPEGEKS